MRFIVLQFFFVDPVKKTSTVVVCSRHFHLMFSLSCKSTSYVIIMVIFRTCSLVPFHHRSGSVSVLRSSSRLASNAATNKQMAEAAVRTTIVPVIESESWLSFVT